MARNAVATLVLLAASSHAQGVSGVITPNPTTAGAPVTITVTDANGLGVLLTVPCTAESIHYGRPNGPMVLVPVCLPRLTALGPCASRSNTWTLPPGSAPGDYWFKVRYWDVNQTYLSTDWFCVTILAPGEPTLTAQTPARVGQPLVATLSSPSDPGAFYAAAISYTTNVGVPLSPSRTIAMDLDPLFFLSFPQPVPGLFTNFQGNLDGSGNSLPITVQMPSSPVLPCKPFHLQAVVVTAQGVKLSNPLNFTIGP